MRPSLCCGRLGITIPCLAVLLSFVPPHLNAFQAEDRYSTKERISRIRDLGKRKADAIPALSDYLNDKDKDIRLEAVKAIVKIGGPESLAPLSKAANDKYGEVQIKAVDGLVNYYLSGYVAKGITAPITRSVRQAKSFVVPRNEQIIDPAVQVQPDVLESVKNVVANGTTVEARIAGARAAGILRDRPAVPALASALHAHENALVFESLVALQKIKDKSAGPAVAGATRDLDEKTQLLALETAGQLRATDSAPDLRSVLKHARNIKVERAALGALAMLGLSEDRSEFQQYIDSKDPELRVAALEGLGRIREPEDVPTLEKAYNEPETDWRVHLAAAFGLVNQGNIETKEFSPLPYLVENIQMKSRSDTAAAYLAEVARREDVRQALIPLISQTGRDGKLVFCSVLGESGEKDVEPVLEKLTHDINPDVATAAARAMKQLQARMALS